VLSISIISSIYTIR